MKLEFLPLKKIVTPPFRGGIIFSMGAASPLNFPWTLGGGQGGGTNFFKNFWGDRHTWGDPPRPPPVGKTLAGIEFQMIGLKYFSEFLP